MPLYEPESFLNCPSLTKKEVEWCEILDYKTNEERLIYYESEHNRDWEDIAKRMIVINQLGIRIEEDSGHRYIIFDDEADFSIQDKFIEAGVIPERDMQSIQIVKHYGSYTNALDRIDRWLSEVKEPSLLDKFNKWFLDEEEDADEYGLGRIFNHSNDAV